MKCGYEIPPAEVRLVNTSEVPCPKKRQIFFLTSLALGSTIPLLADRSFAEMHQALPRAVSWTARQLSRATSEQHRLSNQGTY